MRMFLNTDKEMLYQELIGISEGKKILVEIILPRIFESSQS